MDTTNNENNNYQQENSTADIPQVTTTQVVETSVPTFSMKSPTEFLNVCQTISTLVDEATFEVTSEGLTFRGMDPSHVALIDMNLPRESFEVFECQSAVKFGVRIDAIVNTLKKFDALDPLTITIDGSMLILKQYEITARHRLIESTGGSTPLPKLNFNAQFSMGLGLKKFLKFLDLSEYVTLNSSQMSVRLESKDDYGEYNSEYTTADNLEEVLVKEDSKATYSNEYLKKVLRVLAPMKKSVKFEYSTKMPLRLEVRPTMYATIHFYLAPRVQD
jgi:proliferating cell nuclear antigen